MLLFQTQQQDEGWYMMDGFSAFHWVDSVYLLPHEGTTKIRIWGADFSVFKYQLEIISLCMSDIFHDAMLFWPKLTEIEILRVTKRSKIINSTLTFSFVFYLLELITSHICFDFLETRKKVKKIKMPCVYICLWVYMSDNFSQLKMNLGNLNSSPHILFSRTLEC